MKMKFVQRLCVILILFHAGSVLAGEKPHTPKKGSKERKAIMDALRVPVEKELKQKIIFSVETLKVLKGFAYLAGAPLQPDGRPYDAKKAGYEEIFENGVCALLKKEKNQWRVISYSLNYNDIPWSGWLDEYKAPRQIFP